MEMGVEDVKITDYSVNYDNTQLIIEGKNFTPWSDVYVNDAKVSTEFISDTRLRISLNDVHDMDTIVVNQVGSSDTIFRSSNMVTYYEATPEPTDYSEDISTRALESSQDLLAE